MQIWYKGEDKFEIKTKLSTIFLSSQNDQTKVNNVVLAGAGEYEVSDAQVKGFDWGGYAISSEGLHVLYTDGSTKLSQHEIESLDDVDILIVPAEGSELIKSIEPRMVIPFGKGLEAFCKNQPCPPAVPSVKVVAKDLSDKLTIAILKS